jgi:hypothetical protein
MNSILNLLRRRRLGREIPEEIESHIQERADDWNLWPYGYFARWRSAVPAFSDMAASGRIDRSNVKVGDSGSVVASPRRPRPRPCANALRHATRS